MAAAVCAFLRTSAIRLGRGGKKSVAEQQKNDAGKGKDEGIKS